MNNRFNPSLMKSALAEFNKSSFVPMPGGQIPPDPSMSQGAPPGAPPGGDPSQQMPPGAMPPGGDPAAAGGQPPMDPAMMQQMMGGDPSGMGGPPPDPTGAAIDPSAGGAPPSPPADIKKQIHEALVENGVVKAPKVKPEEQFAHIQSILESICGALGIQCPPMPVASSKDGKSDSGSKPADSKPEPKSAALKNALNKMRGQ